MSRGIRSFVAVSISEEIRKLAGAFVETLGREVHGVRWVKPENLHLTLKFLGDVSEGQLPELKTALDGAAGHHRPFSLGFGGAGVFPPRGRPRVVWIDLAAGAGEMAALQADVEGGLEPLGFPPEGRPFSPHLTIGRAGKSGDPRALSSALAAAGDISWGECVVDRVHLMRSDLFPTGPRYSILHEARFAAKERSDREENT
jgi:2'-5' RNA ligase